MKKYYKKFEAQARYWNSALENYNDEPFVRVETSVNKSISQVYVNLISKSINLYLERTQQCLDLSSKTSGGKTIRGKLTFLNNSLSLSKKERVMFEGEPGGEMVKIAEVKNSLIKLMKLMSKMALSLDNFDKDKKVKHDVFGMLNALEWYRLVEISFTDQLKVKEKIDAGLMRR